MVQADRTRDGKRIIDTRRTSTTDLARVLGCSRATVVKLRKRGVLRPTAPGKFDIAQAVQAYTAWVAHGHQTAAQDSARAETERERQRKLRLSNDALQARLIPAGQVRSLADEVSRAVAEAVDPLPGRVAADIAATENPALIRRRLRDEVRRARTDIADRLGRLAGRRPADGADRP